MTSPLAVVGLTYDTEDLQLVDLQIFLEIRRGLNEPPTVRGVDVIVPARAGRVETNRINDILPIELFGCCQSDPAETDPGDAIATFRANQQFLRTLFSPKRARADLVATLEDASQLSISARPLPGILWNVIVPSIYAEVSIELEGIDDWVSL